MLNIVRPHFPPLESFDAKFSHALKTGQVTNNGEHVQEFERILTEYLGVPTICFSSGQAALMTMLSAVGVEGGEVVCPSFTFCATPHAVAWNESRVVFADIDPDTLCIDPDDIESRITTDTRAILGVDAYGICCDYDRLMDIGQHYQVPVIFDSAAAFGSTYNGKLTGGFGSAQIFSFHATKPFSTMEGGCLCSNDPVLLGAAKRIRNFGQDDDGDCRLAGMNGKMMEVCALIGIEAMKAWPVDAISRKNAAARLRVAIRRCGAGRVPCDKVMDQDPIWLYQPVMIEADDGSNGGFQCSRDDVITGLRRFDIIARKYYQPAHKMSVYRASEVELPVTERAGSEVVALPVYSDMTNHEIDSIAMALKNIKSGEY